MFALILQVGGFLALYVVLLVFLAVTRQPVWALLIAVSMTVHFAGDYFRGMLKKSDPLVIAGFNLNENLQPAYFALFVGGMLQLIGLTFALTGHSQWAAALGGTGTALFATGFVGSIIYNPKSNIEW